MKTHSLVLIHYKAQNLKIAHIHDLSIISKKYWIRCNTIPTFSTLQAFFHFQMQEAFCSTASTSLPVLQLLYALPSQCVLLIFLFLSIVTRESNLSISHILMFLWANWIFFMFCKPLSWQLSFLSFMHNSLVITEIVSMSPFLSDVLFNL